MNDGRWMDRSHATGAGHSRIHQDEHDLGFADHVAVHQADAFGAAHFPARLRELDVNDERVAGPDGLAPFHGFRRHEVGDLAPVPGLLEREDAGRLRDRLELEDARHVGWPGKWPWK